MINVKIQDHQKAPGVRGVELPSDIQTFLILFLTSKIFPQMTKQVDHITVAEEIENKIKINIKKI